MNLAAGLSKNGEALHDTVKRELTTTMRDVTQKTAGTSSAAMLTVSQNGNCWPKLSCWSSEDTIYHATILDAFHSTAVWSDPFAYRDNFFPRLLC